MKANLTSRLRKGIASAGLSLLLTASSGCVQPPPRDGQAYTQEELNEIESRNLASALLEGGLLGLGMVAPNIKQAAALTGASRAVGAASSLNNQVTAAQAGRTQVNINNQYQPSGSIEVYLAGGWMDKNIDGLWSDDELQEVGKHLYFPRNQINCIVYNKTDRSVRGISMLSEISLYDKEKNLYLPFQFNGERYLDVEMQPKRGWKIPFQFDEKSERRGHYKGKFKVRVQGDLVGEVEYMFQTPPQS